MRTEIRQRSYDGLYAVWRTYSHEDTTSRWECIAVVKVMQDAAAIVRENRPQRIAA
jgi:hypothetical protein